MRGLACIRAMSFGLVFEKEAVDFEINKEILKLKLSCL